MDYYLLQEADSTIPIRFESGIGLLLLESSEDNMTDQIEIQIPQTIVPEETTFTLTAYFRTRGSKTASVPTTVHYRVDCLSTKRQITDWTSVAIPSDSNEIVITSAQNQILDDAREVEVKQITVKTDSGLSTQVIKPAHWRVRNLQGIT